MKALITRKYILKIGLYILCACIISALMSFYIVKYPYSNKDFIGIVCEPDSVYYQEINASLFDIIKNHTNAYMYRNKNKLHGAIRLDFANGTMLIVNYQSNSEENLKILINQYKAFISKNFSEYTREVIFSKIKIEEKMKINGFFKLLSEDPYLKIAFKCELREIDGVTLIEKSYNRIYMFVYFFLILIGLGLFIKKHYE